MRKAETNIFDEREIVAKNISGNRCHPGWLTTRQCCRLTKTSCSLVFTAMKREMITIVVISGNDCHPRYLEI